MSLTGDDAQLRALSGRFATVGGAVDRSLEAVEGAVQGAYSDGFSSSSDPWGARWASSKSNPHTLFRSGNLANARTASGGGKVNLFAAAYWVFLQAGANGMEQRAVMPFSHGSKWDEPIESAIGRVVGGHLEAF